MEHSQHSSRHAFRVPHQPQHSSIGTFFKNMRNFDCFGLFKKRNAISPEARDKEKGTLDKEIRKDKGLIKLKKKFDAPIEEINAMIKRANNKIERRNEIGSLASVPESLVT